MGSMKRILILSSAAGWILSASATQSTAQATKGAGTLSQMLGDLRLALRRRTAMTFSLSQDQYLSGT
jgi:hypothetical protein